MEEHGRFDYSPIIDRPHINLPDDARIAVWVIPNIEHFRYDKPGISTVPLTAEFQPDVLNHSWRDYGNRVGIWRIMEVMEKHGIPGTVALNAEVCLKEPRIIEEGNRLGWEWMGHGMTNAIMHSGKPENEERRMIVFAGRVRMPSALGVPFLGERRIARSRSTRTSGSRR